MTITVKTELLACKSISDQARKELERAGCTIHKEVAGLESDMLLVELHYFDMQYDGKDDRTGMWIWGVPREIQIRSHNLYLEYRWSDQIGGYELRVLNEEEQPGPATSDQASEQEDELGDLDEAPF